MRKKSLVLAALLAVTGICVMLWPVFTGHRLQSNAATAVQEFLADRDEPEQQYPELLAALQEYNRQIYTEKQCNLVDLEACEEPAAELTTYGIEDEIIGVLEIPAMELTMPVYLGASDAHLAAGDPPVKEICDTGYRDAGCRNRKRHSWYRCAQTRGKTCAGNRPGSMCSSCSCRE